MAHRTRDLTLALIAGLAGVALVLVAFAGPASALGLPVAGPDSALDRPVASPASVLDRPVARPTSTLGPPPAVPASIPGAPAAPLGLPWIQLDYAQGWIWVTTIPGADVEVVVADGGVTQESGGGKADSGGSFWFGTVWRSGHLQPGDAVTVTAAGVQAIVNPIGSIEGAIDLDADTASGTLHAPWPGSLTVVCDLRSTSGWSPPILQSVVADGGAFTCDFSESADIRRGETVILSYFEPDGDRVMNELTTPAPDAWVDTSAEAGSDAAPGGQALFVIEYGNQGEVPAENVVLTDTLPAGTGYVTDTSGLLRDAGPGVVSWHAGTLAPGEEFRFYVVLTNTLAPGAMIENQVEIATTSEGDNPDNNESDGQQLVGDGQASLLIIKNVCSGDPLPGDTFNCTIGYGNGSYSVSDGVWLTDTLPAWTTLVDWRSQNGYESLWARVPSGPDRVVFHAQALPGAFTDELTLKLALDPAVALDTQLTNGACIGPVPDTGEQCLTFSGARTRPARLDLNVNKLWDGGQLVPGETMNYILKYSNNGNATAHNVWLTDTLPAGTHFITAFINSRLGEVPFAPEHQAGRTVAWNLGTQAPGDAGEFGLELRIDAGVQPGTRLVNRASIGGSEPDDYPLNDSSQDVETVFAPGPNLRVRKTYDWSWSTGALGYNFLNYEIHFENIGTTVVDDVRITDTLPARTWFSGSWWYRSPGPIALLSDLGDNPIVWEVSSLEPGQNSRLGLHARLDADVMSQQGLIYTNTVAIDTPPGDPSPADNVAQAVAFTGPDLYVEKLLKAGTPKAGEFITFTVTFGNRNIQPWRVSDPGEDPATVLTETLPSGMEFIEAIPAWDPTGHWQPAVQDGRTVAWHGWPLVDGERSSVDIVVKILPDVPFGSLLTSTIEIRDIVPGDAEAYEANNRATASVHVGNVAYLSLVRK